MTDEEFVEAMAHEPPSEMAQGIVLTVQQRDRLVALAREALRLRQIVEDNRRSFLAIKHLNRLDGVRAAQQLAHNALDAPEAR